MNPMLQPRLNVGSYTTTKQLHAKSILAPQRNGPFSHPCNAIAQAEVAQTIPTPAMTIWNGCPCQSRAGSRIKPIGRIKIANPNPIPIQPVLYGLALAMAAAANAANATGGVTWDNTL